MGGEDNDKPTEAESEKRKSDSFEVLDEIGTAATVFGKISEVTGVAAVVSIASRISDLTGLTDWVERLFKKKKDKRSATSKKHGWK